MESKKNSSVYLENKRLSLLSVGLLFVGSLVLASFSYTKKIKSELERPKNNNITQIDYLQVEEKETPPEVEETTIKYKPPVAEEIKEKENSNDTITSFVVVTPPDIKIDSITTIVKEEVIDFPDIEAGFPGGAVELKKWMASNVMYPEISIELNEQGRVYVSFVVEKDGRISNVRIERGVSKDLDDEAKRVVRNMPNWKPGEVKGKKVRTKCSLPINFEIK
jgi:protein TonB